MMRDDFCVFILTHGRPDNVKTYGTLKKAGYTGKIYLVIDDEDPSGPAYVERYGTEVLTFCKRKAVEETDDGDNFTKGTVLYARNASFELARAVGCKLFMQLDDDYSGFCYKHGPPPELGYKEYRIRTTMDDMLTLLLEFYESTNILTLAMSQGGDHIGGFYEHIWTRRKAMNSFICSTERPFRFIGRMNDDVNTYVTLGRRGHQFLTLLQVMLHQAQTQANAGGLTELYLEMGTYTKSFYTVLYAPSCCKVGVMWDPASPNPRLHHVIDWPKAAPMILREEYRR